MPTIDDYANNLELALVDAVTDPVFKAFIEPSDLQAVLVDRGDGTQAQVQALSKRSVRRAIEKIVMRAQTAGLDMKAWICSPDEFDLCSKLNTPVGELMRKLNAFLKGKFAEGGAVTAACVVAFTAPPVAAMFTQFLAVFAAVGFVNKAFVELCDCPGA